MQNINTLIQNMKININKELYFEPFIGPSVGACDFEILKYFSLFFCSFAYF